MKGVSYKPREMYKYSRTSLKERLKDDLDPPLMGVILKTKSLLKSVSGLGFEITFLFHETDG